MSITTNTQQSRVGGAGSPDNSPAAVITSAEALCRRADRLDLLRRLGIAGQRLRTQDVRVLVVGQHNQGKSQLINAMLNAPVCPVDDDVATAVPTEVAYAEQARATVLVAVGPGAQTNDQVRERPVPIAQLSDYIRRPRTEFEGERVVGARAFLPRTLLKSGLVLVDTPGTGGVESIHSALTRAALPTADAVLLVTDASSELTAPELDFLREALRACPTVIGIQSKTDLFPDWRRVLEINQGHLTTAGLDLTMVPVSAQLRLTAAARKDMTLNAESGFPVLLDTINQRIVGRRDALVRTSTRHDVTGVLEDLTTNLRREQGVLEDPKTLSELTAELTETRRHAEELKRRSARWQTTLSDGVGDLNSDLDHDLRDRIRRVVREAEAAIDEGDPAEDWETFAAWLEERVSASITDTFQWADENATWLLNKVGEHFTQEAMTAVPAFEMAGIEQLASKLEGPGLLTVETLNPAQKFFIGLRGSYGGVLMFGLLTGLAGLAVINPISLGAGLILGTKAYREDAGHRLNKRRSDAKNLVRRYTDEVAFQCGKTLRDRLRQVQRIVREYYITVAEELAEALTRSVEDAKRAATATTTERKARIETVTALLADAQKTTQDALRLTLTSATGPVTPTTPNAAPPPRRPTAPAAPAPTR